MNSDRCRPGSTRTATLVARHSDFAANACGKATIWSSAAARTNIGASMSNNLAERPSEGKTAARQAVFTKEPFRHLEEIDARQIDRARVPGVEPLVQCGVAGALQSCFGAVFIVHALRPQGKGQRPGDPALQEMGEHRGVPLLSLLERHLQGALQRGRDGVRLVRIDDQGAVELLRRAGELR